MFGPVPAKYQLIVWMSGLVVFAGLGALVSPLMGTIGLSIGALVTALFLHDFEHPRRERVAHSG